jgi:predicted acylesterase/phospholipase RssA
MSIIPRKDSDAVDKARQILRGQDAEPRELLKLSKSLKCEMRFGFARRLLMRAINHKCIDADKDLRHKIFQQLALCTYKDQDLPADDRLARALQILQKVENFKETKNQESLGLLGSIHKRKWEVDTQRHQLERSLGYYMRGYAEGPANDQGYTGINAAFVLDQLASLEEGAAEQDCECPTGDKESVKTPESAEEKRALANKIRQDIIDQVEPLIKDENHNWVADEWWYYATIAEAYFGLGQYDDAVKQIKAGQAKVGTIYEWELETCARQLAALARMQSKKKDEKKQDKEKKESAEKDEEKGKGEQSQKVEEFKNTGAWDALEKAFGSDAVPRTAFLGKIGLALSGGGFRASLYHLGVLARLAELDVLRQVEVLSCVSGGSIVGAHYYLKVRHLLQTKSEDEIGRDDYINLVREMIDEFAEGVKKNVRMSLPLNPFKTFWMLWDKDYSRTARAGELYEKYLYSRISDGGENDKRWLSGLTIAPLIKKADGSTEKNEDFAPKYQNWRRDAKVPILVLNAATLNTGHTWQFTATWMGESPHGIDSEIDGNDRLRRLYYGDAPEKHQNVRLGAAVGASAAVPGIFEPLTLDGLYPDRIVRLVDGGVCDNQGVASLFEQDCRVMLVSDASGQMSSQTTASRSIHGVLLRTYDVFQARIREAQYHDLKGRRRASLLLGLMFVHLKSDLEIDPIDWTNCQDPYVASDDARPPSRRGRQTRYGIAKDVQNLLSGIRTDLDSFSDAEAYALMTSGYRMTEHQFRYEKCVEGFADAPQALDWKFLQIEESMKVNGAGYDYLKKLLAAGGSLAFKVWKIDPILKYGFRITMLLIAALIAWLGYQYWKVPFGSAAEGTGIVGAVSSNLVNAGNALPKLTLSQVILFIVSILASIAVIYLITRILSSLIGDFLTRNVIRLVRLKDTLRNIALCAVLSTVGFVVAVVHKFFDWRFLQLGSMRYIERKRRR